MALRQAKIFGLGATQPNQGQWFTRHRTRKYLFDEPLATNRVRAESPLAHHRQADSLRLALFLVAIHGY